MDSDGDQINLGLLNTSIEFGSMLKKVVKPDSI